MYQDLLRKIAEEKPNYNQEEIQWLFDHLGNPSPEIRDDLSNQGLHYLSKEKDTTGFSSQYGWVHSFAHGADLLTEVVCHPDFPKNRVHEVFDILGQLFKRMSIRFTDDEDWRLARVIYEPILQGKLEQEQVASWIKTVDFPIEEREDFSKFSNFRSCLVEVYVQLDQRNSLQDELKEAIQSFQYYRLANSSMIFKKFPINFLETLSYF